MSPNLDQSGGILGGITATPATDALNRHGVAIMALTDAEVRTAKPEHKTYRLANANGM
ncbi:hypothetical protein PHO31112_04091 [Pandoraea horticolens]|uniref:Uncharacterized protein n=1 Tax=Pandoraea horticolens TaxID=2508298 RepID=A0A5E4XU88_9BURK|nr:hypothetical protein PHO31112_04091 [Pandoraea horticolens]